MELTRWGERRGIRVAAAVAAIERGRTAAAAVATALIRSRLGVGIAVVVWARHEGGEMGEKADNNMRGIGTGLYEKSETLALAVSDRCPCM